MTEIIGTTIDNSCFLWRAVSKEVNEVLKVLLLDKNQKKHSLTWVYLPGNGQRLYSRIGVVLAIPRIIGQTRNQERKRRRPEKRWKLQTT